MAANPQASVRDVAAQAAISKSTVWRILKDSDFHPYHVSLHQCWEDRDFQNRLDFSNRKSLPVSYKKDAKNSRKLTEFMLIFILSYKFESDRIEALIRKAKTS